jgi:hydrogenase-4 component F
MIITPTITLALYALIGLAAVLLVVASKSHRTMNIITIALPAAYLILAVYSLSNLSLPSIGLGGNYFFMDHLGIYEVVISAVLFLLAAIYARGYIERSIDIGEMSQSSLKLFYLAFNLLLMAITYAFFSDNLALFWILAELTTAFSAVLVVILNAPKNIGATLKYVFITSTCMLFAFIGLILMFTLSESTLGAGTLNWSSLMTIASKLSPAIMFAAFLFTFVGFAAKSGIVPFHAWLPSAHSKAPAPVSAILSGSVTSVGIYGIIRMYALVSQTPALSKISIFLIAFGIISMLVAALTMLRQVNLKKLTGYSTIEHMGFLLVALGLGTPIAIFWMLFYVMAHAFTKGSLFFSAGILHHQYESVRMEHIKNALKLQPFASWTLIIGGIAIIGTPMFALFLPKISILLQAASVSPFLLFGLLLIFVIAAGAIGIFLIKLLSQKETADKAEIKPYKAPICMVVPIVVLLSIVFVLGVFFPQQLTDLLNSIVGELGRR